jgi:ABC transport system ATP-binding/permease protein
MDSESDFAIEIRWPGGHTERRAITRLVTSVGRNPSNDIPVAFQTVSGRHLQIVRVDGGLELTDLHSTNGTRVNGQLVGPGVPHVIRPGDVVRIGDPTGNSITFLLAFDGDEPARRPPAESIPLASDAGVLIGRDPACAVRLDHPSVSRRHAEIIRTDGGHALRDLGSGNGSFVNGRRVADQTPLRVGDVVQIGPFVLSYDPGRASVESSVSRGYRLEAVDIGVTVAGGRKILDRVSLTVEAGEFVALVGGSGAGKSTLMKALNGYSRATAGRMLIDGRDLYAALDLYRPHMGFVPQDDIIHRELPVAVALRHAAGLRLPDATPEEIEARVADVLNMVDLKAHAGKRVAVLSGGQRKRVSIAVELLAEPVLLFLDEPTSGLDPGLEKKMMYDLGRLADAGRTVVLVTHATGNIEQCHLVAFLAQGRLAYYGPPREAITFFGAEDFSDIYLKLSAEIRPGDDRTVPPELARTREVLKDDGRAGDTTTAGALWAEQYRRSPIHRTYVEQRQRPPLPAGSSRAASGPGVAGDSTWRQLRVLVRRQWDLYRYDSRTLLTLLLLPPFVGLLLGLVGKQNALVGLQLEKAQVREELRTELRGAPKNTKAEYIPEPDAVKLLTMMIIGFSQIGTFGAAYQIVNERSIFKRERAVNLRVPSYVLSKAIVLGGFAIVQIASAMAVMSLLVDLRVTPIFQGWSGSVELFCTLVIASIASVVFGLFVSALSPSNDSVVYIVLAQLLAQMVLSGTYFPLHGNPVSKLAISYWAAEATGSTLGLRELNQESQVCQVVEIPGSKSTQIACNDAPLSDDEMSLDFTHSPSHLLYSWMGLLAHVFCWGGLTMWVQARKAIE